MRKVSFIVLAAVAVYLLAVPLALGQGGSVEQQIKTLLDQSTQARLKGDSSFFEKHFADDATIVHSDGTISTKAQEIENMKSGTVKYESIEVRETKIQVYGNTAVSTQLVSFKGVLSGKPVSADVRVTGVYVKQKGNWKIVAFLNTRLPASK